MYLNVNEQLFRSFNCKKYSQNCIQENVETLIIIRRVLLIISCIIYYILYIQIKIIIFKL